MTSSNILFTKFQRPHAAAGTIERPRLHELLNQGRRQQCTLISAPAGYGKSTLVSSWIGSCQCPSIWISLDEQDSELHTFLSYILAALRQTFPKITFQTEVLLTAPNLPASCDLSRNLLNDLNQITEPFVVILDDYHRLGAGPANEVITELLKYSCSNLHLILLTRHDPQLPVASLRANGRITEMRATDLRFKLTEIRAFMEKMLTVAPDEAILIMLDKKIEGWPAGLRLACLYLQGESNVTEQIAKLTGNSTHIAEYLFAEVLSKLQPEQIDFLLRTSIVDRFCMPLYLAILDQDGKEQNETKHPQTSQLKKWLVNSNLFLISLDRQGYWYRYHHLFQEFLNTHLIDVFTQQQIHDLHRRASLWFTENNWIDESIHHAFLADDARLAAQLILQNRYTLMGDSQFLRLQRWLKQLPEDIVAENPLLSSTKAYLAIEFGQDHDVYANLVLAQQALASPTKSETFTTLKAEVDILMGFIEMVMGDAPKALIQVKESDELLPQQAFMIRSMSILTLAGCYQMTGQMEFCHRTVKNALQNPGWPENLRARLHFYLSIALYMNGDLYGAIAASHDSLQIALTKPNAHTLTFAYCQLGTAHYCRNELDLAEYFTKKVIDVYEVSNPTYAANAGYILACIYTLRNENEEAHKLLDELAEHFLKNNYLTILEMTKAFQVELALRQGNSRKASQICGVLDFDMRPPMWFFYVPQFTPIKLLLANGSEQSVKEASMQSAGLEKQLNRSNRKNVLIDLLAIQSIVCQKSGDESKALGKLRAALDIAEPGGWIRNFVDLGKPMEDLLECLRRSDPSHAYAQKVLSAFRKEFGNNTVTHSINTPQSPSEKIMGSTLTKRETELLYVVAEGLSNKEIAERHNIAAETVKTHLRNIYKKIKVRGRLAAVRKAHAMGIFSKN